MNVYSLTSHVVVIMSVGLSSISRVHWYSTVGLPISSGTFVYQFLQEDAVIVTFICRKKQQIIVN